MTKMRTALSFDDVLLVPKHYDGLSRSEVDLSTVVSGLHLKHPIVAANMATVCGEEMASYMGGTGGLGIIHRMCSIEEQARMVRKARGGFVGAAIGVGKDAKERALACLEAGASILCVDVAHADQKQVLDLVYDFFKKYTVPVIVGNLATAEAAKTICSYLGGPRLSLKVGVGGGSVCTTRLRTGCGLPTFESILRVAEEKERSGTLTTIIADGGIRSSGDIVKALAAGADAIMLGSMLAGTDEAPGNTIRTKDGLFKMYYGSASHRAKKEFFGSAEYVEGAERLVPYKGSVAKVLAHTLDGVRSGLTYCGATTLDGLRVRAEFVRVTNSGLVENGPHGLL